MHRTVDVASHRRAGSKAACAGSATVATAATATAAPAFAIAPSPAGGSAGTSTATSYAFVPRCSRPARGAARSTTYRGSSGGAKLAAITMNQAFSFSRHGDGSAASTPAASAFSARSATTTTFAASPHAPPAAAVDVDADVVDDGASSSQQPTCVAPILMGSKADLPHCEKIAAACRQYGIEPVLHIASAHKVPARLLALIHEYESNTRQRKVYISVAGRSNALSGMLDCAVRSPVIACPPPSEAFGGADIFSSLRMPGGVAPMVVLDPANAALAAAKIFGLMSAAVRDKVDAVQAGNRARLYVDDAELSSARVLPAIERALSSGNLLTETSLDGLSAQGKSGGGGGAAITVQERRCGKVRDQYYLNDGTALMLTTDRQSAFDRVLAAVPFKGAVLNMTSAWWFRATEHIVPNHMLDTPHPNALLARRCDPFPVEFVVRGFVTGSTATSLWKNYERGVRRYCGIDLPDGLHKNQRLAENIVTPTTKDDAGDALISPDEIVERGLMSRADYEACARAALQLFAFGQRTVRERGLILVDTKYEFGRDPVDGTIRLIDEVHTPDSSRYWLAPSYEARVAAGKEPENIDKEVLRLWFRDHCDPYRDATLPTAPRELVVELSRRYVQLYEMITAERFTLDRAWRDGASLDAALSAYLATR